MILFLRRIPEHSDNGDIIDFLKSAVKGSLFQQKGKIENIKILALKDIQKNTLEYHGLVTISPEKVATRVMKTLNRQPFNDRNIIVREYFHRSWHNDPRVNMHQWNEELLDKRKHNRRRGRLESVTEESMKFNHGNELSHRVL